MRRLRRLVRLFDWRLALALTLMVMVAYLVWSGAASHQRAERAGVRVDQLLSTVHEERLVADERAHVDARERARLLASQRAQTRELRDLAQRYWLLERRQAALLRWLREQGITPPASVLRISRPSSVRPGGSSSPRPSGRGPGKASGKSPGKPSGQVSGTRPRSPQSKPIQPPKAGKSGKTPGGKAKGLRRSKR